MFSMLFSDSHIACLILLVMARNWLTPSVVVNMPITDTRHPFSIQPPSLWPSKTGDCPNPQAPDGNDGDDESDNDDDNDDDNDLGLDENNDRQTDDELEEPVPFVLSDDESQADPTDDRNDSDSEEDVEPPKKTAQKKRSAGRSKTQGKQSKKRRIYPDIENIDIDEEPVPQFSSTPKPSTSTRPSTARPSTSSSGRKRFIPPFNPQPSTSSSGSRSTRSTNNGRMEEVEKYLRDLEDFRDAGKDTKVPRFANFNGR